MEKIVKNHPKEIKLICQNPKCGKKFIVKWAQRNRKYCRQKCQVPWLKGKTGMYSEETLEKKRQASLNWYKTEEGEKHKEKTRQRNLKSDNPWLSKNKTGNEEWEIKRIEAIKKTYQNPEIRQKCDSMSGKTHSNKTIKKMSEKRKLWWKDKDDTYKKEYGKKMSKANFGKVRTEDFKKNQRKKIIQHIKDTNGAVHPIQGKNEKKILDDTEKKIGHKIIRDYVIQELGYFPDGYCEATNTIYEVYEKYHTNVSQKEKDKQRQKEICQLLKCKFKIIWDIN